MRRIFIFFVFIINLSLFAEDNAIYNIENSIYGISCGKNGDATTCIGYLEGKESESVVKEISKPTYYPFGVGFGVGNPFANLILSFPYIDFEIGYGSFVGLAPDNFLPYTSGAIDLIFRHRLGSDFVIGGGVGTVVDFSQTSVTHAGATNPFIYNIIGTGLRIPLILEYNFTSLLAFGIKIAPTFGTSISLTLPDIIFEGFRFNFFGSFFLKFYI